MAEESALAFEDALGVLRQLRGARQPASRLAEHCELCSAQLGHDHPHLVELDSRRVVCACDACALLFDSREQARFKRVSRDIYSLANFQLTDAQWDSLIIPINLAFFFRSSLENRMVALYPSPAGAVESLLTLEAWSAIVADNPILERLKPDVEALLVNRIVRTDKTSGSEYYIAPIDVCYKLVGLIRTNWKGLSGGTEVWAEIDAFFADLRAKSEPADGGANA